MTTEDNSYATAVIVHHILNTENPDEDALHTVEKLLKRACKFYPDIYIPLYWRFVKTIQLPKSNDPEQLIRNFIVHYGSMNASLQWVYADAYLEQFACNPVKQNICLFAKALCMFDITHKRTGDDQVLLIRAQSLQHLYSKVGKETLNAAFGSSNAAFSIVKLCVDSYQEYLHKNAPHVPSHISNTMVDSIFKPFVLNPVDYLYMLDQLLSLQSTLETATLLHLQEQFAQFVQERNSLPEKQVKSIQQRFESLISSA
jgi:hypothetical protein